MTARPSLERREHTVNAVRLYDAPRERGNTIQ